MRTLCTGCVFVLKLKWDLKGGAVFAEVEWKLVTKNQTSWAESKWRHFLQFVFWHHKHRNEFSDTLAALIRRWCEQGTFPLETFSSCLHSRQPNEQTAAGGGHRACRFQHLNMPGGIPPNFKLGQKISVESRQSLPG